MLRSGCEKILLGPTKDDPCRVMYTNDDPTRQHRDGRKPPSRAQFVREQRRRTTRHLDVEQRVR